MKSKSMPASVVKRLTRYLAHVHKLRAAGIDWVSSLEVARNLGLTSSTVRQDLSHVEYCGVSKRGYGTLGLEKCLATVLGADKTWRMVVVGAGNLGRALVLHEEFRRHGFRICGVFDSDRKKIGKKMGGLRVASIEKLLSMAREKRVDIGIIAAPAPVAQDIADLLTMAGARGILNLTSSHISAPGNIAVVDVRIVASLQELVHSMKTKKLRG